MTIADDTEVFILTCGDRPSFSAACRGIGEQDTAVPYTIIKDVAPMSAAFNRMLTDGNGMPFFVQCDDDMILLPHAIRQLRETIAAQGPNCALVALWLWDPHVERPIVGVKIYRRAAVQQIGGWKNVQSCEVVQLEALKVAGWTIHVPGPESKVILGRHEPMFTPEMAYERYRDLVLKQRRYGLALWTEELPNLFLSRFEASGDSAARRVDLAALAGCIAGATADLASTDVEKDFRNKPWKHEFEYVAKLLEL